VRDNTPTFYLVGGIGNQLFGYAAGMAFSKVNKTPVKYVLSQIERSITHHGSTILTLSLDIDIDINRTRLQRLRIRFSNKLSRLIRNATGQSIWNSQVYRSTEIGYDANFLKSKYLKSFHGYFQSWKYVDTVYEIFPTSDKILRSPSEWFCRMSELAILVKPIVIHVRRGDYKKLTDTYGELSADYYASALRLVRELLPENPIWVFSDDIEGARDLLFPILPEDANWIIPPSEKNPVESLVLMSLGAANIIANSTFSWWSAMLNRSSVITLAPHKWFRSLTDPKDLYPPNWILVKSSWQN